MNFFKELFLPDDNRKNYDECHIRLRTADREKNHNFLSLSSLAKN